MGKGQWDIRSDLRQSCQTTMDRSPSVLLESSSRGYSQRCPKADPDLTMLPTWSWMKYTNVMLTPTCMFRHDPKALLYAPLRMLVHSDADGNAVFTMDQPGPAFGSLGIAEVAEVGLELDRKVANLLRVVGVDVGQAFG